MSVKAYGGFRIRKTDFFKVVSDATVIANNSVNQKLDKHIVARAIALMNQCVTTPNAVDFDGFVEPIKLYRKNISVEDRVCARLIDTTRDMVLERSRKSNIDHFLAKVDFFTSDRKSDRYVYGYTNEGDYVGDCLFAFSKHTLVQEYGYWNNSDKPDEVSDREWRRRGKVWENVDMIQPHLVILVSSKDTIAYSESFFSQELFEADDLRKHSSFPSLIEKVEKHL